MILSPTLRVLRNLPPSCADLGCMQVPGLEPEGEGDDEEEEPVLAAAAAAAGGGAGKWQSRVASDSLKDDLRRKQAYIKKCILDAAQLIADQVGAASSPGST